MLQSRPRFVMFAVIKNSFFSKFSGNKKHKAQQSEALKNKQTIKKHVFSPAAIKLMAAGVFFPGPFKDLSLDI